MNLSLTLFAQLLVFVIPALVLAAIFFVVRHLRRHATSEQRMAKLDALHVAGKISAAEYERRRASMMSGVKPSA